MAFGYAFVDLDDAQKAERRFLLDSYGLLAQWSVLVVLALFQLSFFLSWLFDRGLGDERPSSPSFSKNDPGAITWLRRCRLALRRSSWWMRKPLFRNWGTRGEWVYGLTWTAWLVFLSMNKTGNDYLHLTKRFGIVGASQLPLHYLLAIKTPYSPVQLLTRLSHEQLKAHHQVLGRIILFLFTLHVALYLNLFFGAGVLLKRIKNKDVILGLISIFMFYVLGTTALGYIRRRSYRVFYLTHVIIALSILVPLYFHVHHIRLYIMEVFVIVLIQQALRLWSLHKRSGTIKLVPGTSVVEIRISLSTGQPELRWKPGQHVYLSPPSGVSSAYDHFLLSFRSNPFTIASIPGKDKELLLVARIMEGNTKEMAKLAKSLASASGSREQSAKIPLTIEGPFGASTWLPDLSAFDKVLFVAGGVGATFIVPLYRSLVEGELSSQAPEVHFVWAVRKLAETQWAIPASSTEDQDEEHGPFNGHSVDVYVTRPSGADLQAEDDGSDIELAEDEQLLSLEEEMGKPRPGMTLQSGRPNLSMIVESVIGKRIAKVAVIACGPRPLVDELKDCVDRWVGGGYDVFWHQETFGW